MIAPYFCVGAVDAEQMAGDYANPTRSESWLVESLLRIGERFAKLLRLHVSHAS